MGIPLKTRSDIGLMREAGKIVAETLELLREMVRPGITTAQLDSAAQRHIESGGATPSFLGYKGYPASLCASLNNEVVHSIPGSRVLHEGDIIKLDTGACYHSFHRDACITVPVGKISAQTRQLMRVYEESLWRGIEQAQTGKRLGDIGAAIQRYAEPQGYAIVRTCTGHGIGRNLHKEPIGMHVGQPGKGLQLRPGMVITIEPILNIGHAATRTLADSWTTVTADGSLSAQHEHTIAITSKGPEILTPWVRSEG